MQRRRFWKIVFLLLILTDVVYTWVQNSNEMMLDGDMSSVVAPSEAYKRVLRDPFAFGVLFHHETYAAPNRFFIHFSMQKYFQTAPFMFQVFLDPVASLFTSLFFARTMLQIILIYLIAVLVTGRKNPVQYDLVVVMLIVTPLFQVNGYHESMGITLNSITYTFFYALPLVFMLLYLLPFVNYFYRKQPLFKGIFKHAALLLLALAIAFGGPTSAPAALLLVSLLSAMVLAKHFREQTGGNIWQKIMAAIQAVPAKIWMHFGFLVLISLYSFWVGTYNSENSWSPMPLDERYQKLGHGVVRLLTRKLGVPLLLGICVLNSILVFRIRKKLKYNPMPLIGLLGTFSLIYVLLLPLGGYREYREYILRADSFAPVTISMMIVFAITFLNLFTFYTGRIKGVFIAIWISLAIIYSNADRYRLNTNLCQKRNLYTLAKSNDPVTNFWDWCNLFSWEPITKPEDSELNARLIQYWNITKEKRLYLEHH